MSTKNDLKKELKRRGLNWVVIAFAAIIFGVFFATFFDPKTSTGSAPAGSVILGVIAAGAAAVWLLFSESILYDLLKIKNHILVQVLQIAVAFALVALAITLFTVHGLPWGVGADKY